MSHISAYIDEIVRWLNRVVSTKASMVVADSLIGESLGRTIAVNFVVFLSAGMRYARDE